MIFAGFSCSFSLLFSQNMESDTIVSKIHHLEQVEIKSTKVNHQILSSSPLQSINKIQLTQQGINDLADALRRFSGVNIKDYGGAGGMKTVSIRSLGSQHTAVAYDGITITDAQSGQIDLSRFTLDNIQSISLTIGDNSDIFQPARTIASAGVVKLQTSTSDFKDKDYNLVSEIKTGSFGLLNPYVRFDRKLSEKTSVSISGDYMRADNQYPFKLVNGNYITNEKRLNNFIETYRTEGNFFLRSSSNSLLSGKAYYYHSFKELPGPVILYNNKSDETQNDRNFFTQLHYHSLLSPYFHLQLNGKFNWSYSSYHDIGNEYPEGELSNYYYQREYYSSGTLMYTPDEQWAVAYSADYSFNNLTTNTSDGTSPYRHTILQSLTGRFQNAKIKLTARLLGSVFDNRAKNGESARDAQRLSPSFSISWKPFERQHLFVRASYKDIFRMATFSECYFSRFGSTTLDPEIARQFNIGMTYAQETPDSWFSGLNMTFDGYYNHIKDKIVAKPYNMFFWTMVNLGRVDIWGTDINLNASFQLRNNQKLLFNTAYTLQYAVNMTDPGSILYKMQIPYTPKNSGAASLSWENPWINMSVHATGVSSRFIVEQNSDANRIPGYIEFGISLYKSFHLIHSHLNTRFDIINMGDKQYSIIKSYPMPGRSFKVSLALII